MPSLTPPELQGLVAIAREEGLDMKPVLLRVLVDLFVAADGHTAEEISQFCEIAGTLAREVDSDTALTVACRLADYHDTPHSVGEALVSRKDDASRIILADAHWLPHYVLVETAAAGHRLMAAAVAARAGLEPAIVRLLVSRKDALIDTTLAANTTLRLTPDVRSELIARARAEEAIARALLSRSDLAPIEKAVLFLVADKQTRDGIMDAAEAMAAGADDRAIMPPAELITGLEAAAVTGDAASFSALLALGLGTSPQKVTRLLRDRTGEALALALVAVGAQDDAIVRIFMVRDPLIGHSTQRVFAMVDLSRRISQAAAQIIVDAMLGTARTPVGHGQHVPVYDPAPGLDRRTPAGFTSEQVSVLRGSLAGHG